MNETTHADIMRRVEKVEIDVAVLDSKSNRLHQDVQSVRDAVKDFTEEYRDRNTKLQEAVTRVTTLVIAVPSVLAFIYTLLNILEHRS